MNPELLIMGLGLLWLAVQRAARGLQIGMDSYEFSGLDLSNGTVKLTLNIKIKNPFIVGVRITGIDGYIYAEGENVGYINMKYDYTLSGGKTHILPVIVNLKIGGALAAAKSNISSGDIRNLVVSFDGHVNVGRIALPIKFEMNYDEMTA